MNTKCNFTIQYASSFKYIYFKFRNNQANDLSNDDIQFKKTDYYLLMHDIKQRKMVLFTFTDI